MDEFTVPFLRDFSFGPLLTYHTLPFLITESYSRIYLLSLKGIDQFRALLLAKLIPA
ncbi:hypothetical protein SCHPADRAFT_908028 [Schizopora paradoxa]|uniref:Uncharacterized protein n=1 Tax=Schizopora paradoxa TaxID=27342 RepID=A0A0H2RB64_9AGAM|nr:hypothetical protein SCHPADRAFT_908028 [Schizopora paradoxa]